MKHMPKLLMISAFFVAVSAFNVYLAWGGDKVALISLAVTIAVLLVGWVIFGKGWREALDGWGRSTEGWSAAQTWGIKQDKILHDVLQELWEYDEEAVAIHNGRSATASLEYLRVFEEDAKDIADGIKESLGKKR